MGSANKLRKLKLLLWKNVILQLRRPIGTAVEVALPIMISSILLILAHYNPINPDRQIGYRRSECSEKLFPKGRDLQESSISRWEKEHRVAYFPINNFTTNIMQRVERGYNDARRWDREAKIKLVNQSIDGHPFATLREVIEDASGHPDRYTAVVTFDDSSVDATVKYSIRLGSAMNPDNDMKTDQVFPYNLAPSAWSQGEFLYLPTYGSAFMILQYWIDSAIIRQMSGNETLSASRFLHRFPVTDITNNEAIMYTIIVPMLIVVAFCYTAAVTVKEVGTGNC